MFGPLVGAISGADTMEIVVALRNLASEGFHKVQADVAKMEKSVNATNLGGFSKTTKAAERDAEKLAEGSSGRGGLAGVAGGMLGLVSPAGLAVTAIGAVAATALATLPTYERVEKQEKALAQAAVDHGIALDSLNAHVDATIRIGEQYAFVASDTRQAVIKLTEAGFSLAEQQAAMPHIMDLARAKNLDLAEATRLYTLALMGNTRGLKDLGIALPGISKKVVDHQKAVEDAKIAYDKLKIAEDTLKQLQDKHAVTVDKLTVSTKGHAASSDQLTRAQERLTLAEMHLSTVESNSKATKDQLTAAQFRVRDATASLNALEQKHGVTIDRLTSKTKGHAATALQLEQAQLRVKEATDKYNKAQALANLTVDKASERAARLKLINDDLTGSVGNQRASVSGLDVKQAELNDKWEKFATKVGPGVKAILGHIIDALSTFVDGLTTAIDLIDKALKLLGGSGRLTGNVASNLIGTHAAGGWVGLNGPELAILGEQGPEYVVPNHDLGGAGSVHHVHVYLDGRQIADVVERHLGQRLNLRGSGIGIGSI